jgi:hemerythrin-like domain-containing protein
VAGMVTKSPDPFEHIGREHAELQRVFALFERLLDRIDAGGEALRPEIALVVTYLDLFGDLRHHDKEESLLAPALIHAGFDWFEGPLARMRRDHRQERYLVRVLCDLVDQDRPWSMEDRRHLLGVGREFLAFMRTHIAFENEQILAPARARLSSEAKASLGAELRRFDDQHSQSTDYVAVRKHLEPLLAKGA